MVAEFVGCFFGLSPECWFFCVLTLGTSGLGVLLVGYVEIITFHLGNIEATFEDMALDTIRIAKKQAPNLARDSGLSC